MTATTAPTIPRIPLTNEGAWNPLDAPPVGDGETSRFAQTRTPAGWGSTPNRVTVDTWKMLVEELKANTPAQPPATKRIELKKVVRVEGENAYAVVSRGVVERVPTLVSVVDGRHKKPKQKAGALLDLVTLGEKDGVLRPEVIWKAARDWAEKNLATPEELRVLNTAIAQAVLVQAGIDVSDLELPNGS
jgi:hypothetical protein